jgi:hypothetical protein
MRYAVMLVTLLAGLVAGSAVEGSAHSPPRPDELVNNPAFEHWAGFKRGTVVVKKETVTLADGRKIQHDITERLAEKTRDKVVVESMTTPTMDAMVSSRRTFTTFPAKVRMDRAHTPRHTLDGFSEGEEEMAVQGKKVTAHWVEAVTRAGDETTTRKVWSAREIPGGVVKETLVRKKGDQVLSDSVLEIVRIKVP